MMRFISAFLVVLFSLPLAGCGFSPVYSTNTANAGTIQINKIEGRTGYVLREALQNKIVGAMRGIESGGVLGIEIEEKVSRLTFRPDGFAARASMNLNGRYNLTLEDKTLDGDVTAVTYFNVPDSEYGDIAVQIETREEVANLLADKIISDILAKLAEK